jgi:hypothetical protein
MVNGNALNAASQARETSLESFLVSKQSWLLNPLSL